VPLILTGTIAGFVCESTPENHSIASSGTARGISFHEEDQSVNGVRLKVDSRYSNMFVQHSKLGKILGGTVLVLNSSNMNLLVNFFIHNTVLNDVTIAVSSLSLQDTMSP